MFSVVLLEGTRMTSLGSGWGWPWRSGGVNGHCIWYWFRKEWGSDWDQASSACIALEEIEAVRTARLAAIDSEARRRHAELDDNIAIMKE